ncbi:MAG: cephalosporin hydroxylase family protein [Magnetococcus sp. DMHC-8]
MDIYGQFKQKCAEQIAAQAGDARLMELSGQWLERAVDHQYCYHFEWLGRPILQLPGDILAMQEIVWSVKPDLVIETGIAHGGSLIFSASLLELNAACGGPPDARVVGVDIDIRPHNRAFIESHPLSKRITMIQGSSIAPAVVAEIAAMAAGKRVLVTLDSNHSHAHVLAELEVYAPLTSVGSYCVVFDTVVEDLAADLTADRPWGPGNSPKTAVWEYLQSHPEFEIDRRMDHKLLISVAPDGYLRRVRQD